MTDITYLIQDIMDDWNTNRSQGCLRLLMMLIVCIPIVLLGCETPTPSPSPPPKPTQRPDHVHKVRFPGQSLSYIAKWYTGQEKNQEQLAAINQIPSPVTPRIDCLEQGTDILIPRELITDIRKIGMPIPRPPYMEHTVRMEGESLSIIAKWYTHDLNNWECLTTTNPHLPASHLIRLGDKIRIPMHMVRTQGPIPETFVKEHVQAIKYYTHTVIWTGESLAQIARWYTGDVRNRNHLAELNPDLPNPNCIKKGTGVLVPRDLITDPMRMQTSISKPPPCIER